MPEQGRIHFLYHRGQTVRYGGEPTRLYTVMEQRYTPREVMSPLYEYRLAPPVEPDGWVSEADLIAIEEDRPRRLANGTVRGRRREVRH